MYFFPLLCKTDCVTITFFSFRVFIKNNKDKSILSQPVGTVEYTPPNECPGYDTKQSDGEAPAMLKLWRMRSTSLFQSLFCPVGWGCRIYRLLLCRGVRPPQRVSWIWHETIWWCGSSDAGALGNEEYSIIAIAFLASRLGL